MFLSITNRDFENTLKSASAASDCFRFEAKNTPLVLPLSLRSASAFDIFSGGSGGSGSNFLHLQKRVDVKAFLVSNPFPVVCLVSNSLY